MKIMPKASRHVYIPLFSLKVITLVTRPSVDWVDLSSLLRGISRV